MDFKKEWWDVSLNPIKGLCKQACFYCYAQGFYKRFKWDTEVTFHLEILDKAASIKTSSLIFLCSTHDIFGYWVPQEWIYQILEKVINYPQHTFIILTKNPQRITDMDLEFPENAWVGTTITGNTERDKINFFWLANHVNAIVKFISFEPLLDKISPSEFLGWERISWVIIGLMTGRLARKYRQPKQVIENIAQYVDKYKIPVFMKKSLLNLSIKIRREWPCKTLREKYSLV